MATLIERFDREEGLELSRLEPSTTLLVWTWNSRYRLVLEDGPDVFLEGGSLFPEPTPAHISGARLGAILVKSGWIGVGLAMEFRVRDRCFVTSPIISIALRPPNATAESQQSNVSDPAR